MAENLQVDYSEYYERALANFRGNNMAQLSRITHSQLRTTAAPCILQNFITDSGNYTFIMEGPQGQCRTEFSVPRNRIDTYKEPKTAADMVIKAMKMVIMNDLDVHPNYVFEQMQLAYPCALDITMSGHGMYNVTVKSEVTGAQRSVQVALSNVHTSVISLSQAVVADEAKYRKEQALAAEQKVFFLDDEMKVEQKVPIKSTMPKVPKCPEHGDNLVPSDTEGELKCPIWGCEKVARRKAKPLEIPAKAIAGEVDLKLVPNPLTLEEMSKAVAAVGDGGVLNMPVSSNMYPNTINLLSGSTMVPTSQGAQFRPNNDPPRVHQENGRTYLIQTDPVSTMGVWIDVTDILTDFKVRREWNPSTGPGLVENVMVLTPRY